jgi:hypothetical protein
MEKTLTCPHCGSTVEVGRARPPIRFITRDAAGRDPYSFVIIGGEQLLHRCEPSRGVAR